MAILLVIGIPFKPGWAGASAYPTSGQAKAPNAIYVAPKRHVGQSFGFASELPLGGEPAIRPVKHREFLAKRVGPKAGGGPEAPALRGPAWGRA